MNKQLNKDEVDRLAKCYRFLLKQADNKKSLHLREENIADFLKETEHNKKSYSVNPIIDQNDRE